MAKPVDLPSKSFRTRAEAKAYCSDIHNKIYAVGDVITDPEHVAVLKDLVVRHPSADEKIGPGIDLFFIGLTSRGDRKFVRAGQTGIWIRDVEGGERDFSYNTAIDQPDERAVVKEALRNAVADERVAFREREFQRGPVYCARTGVRLASWDEAAVVYSDPTWAELTGRFVAMHGGWDAVETHTGYGGVQIGSQLVDDELREDWIAYWRMNSRPQLVAKGT